MSGVPPGAGDVAAIRGVLERRASAIPSVERREGVDATEYLVGGVAVVAVERGSVSFRLGPEIAGAAARTEGASASPRGPDWVRLAPSSLDRFALDRALAWFDLSVRPGGPGR